MSSVGMKCGKEGLRDVQTRRRATLYNQGQTEAWRKSGRKDYLKLVPKPILELGEQDAREAMWRVIGFYSCITSFQRGAAEALAAAWRTRRRLWW